MESLTRKSVDLNVHRIPKLPDLKRLQTEPLVINKHIDFNLFQYIISEKMYVNECLLIGVPEYIHSGTYKQIAPPVPP